MTLTIRPVRVEDMAAIAAIYRHAVLHDTASFELEAPDAAEMERRWRSISDAYPYLVAERAGAVVGYAYAGPHRTRPAYRATCEDSIYIAREAQRTGVGRALLEALIAACEARGYRQMIAGVSGGPASIALHEALGFRVAGRLEAVGFKFGRWIDLVLLQRALGDGATRPL
ncbi:MAG: N-acetyltransferase family protein [Labilithrix sp.]